MMPLEPPADSPQTNDGGSPDEPLPPTLEELQAEEPLKPQYALTRPLMMPPKVGRPSPYKAEYCQLAANLAGMGQTDFEIAEELGVHVRTLYRWQVDHPEFRQALAMAKEVCIERIERTLYTRALGYSYHSVKVLRDGGLVPIVVHVPPDVGAAEFVLTNKRPGEWKHSKTVEIHDPRSEQELLDSIVSKFRNLHRLATVEGEVVPPKLTNGHAKKAKP